MEIAQNVARKIIESCLEHGDPLPAAVRARRRAGKAVLRTSIAAAVDA